MTMAPVKENEIDDRIATAEEAELMAEQMRRLDAFQQALQQEPGLMREIESLVGAYAEKTAVADTIQQLFDSLLFYLESDSVEFLLTVLVSPDNTDLLQQVQAKADPEIWHWLRRLLARYGNQLKEANAISGENSEAWRWLNRRAYYDTVASRWGVSFEIIKFNGERLILEETPRSALGLALGIIDTLNSVPDDIAPDILDPLDVEHFVSQCTILQQHYLRDEEEEVE